MYKEKPPTPKLVRRQGTIALDRSDKESFPAWRARITKEMAEMNNTPYTEIYVDEYFCINYNYFEPETEEEFQSRVQKYELRKAATEKEAIVKAAKDLEKRQAKLKKLQQEIDALQRGSN